MVLKKKISQNKSISKSTSDSNGKDINDTNSENIDNKNQNSKLSNGAVEIQPKTGPPIWICIIVALISLSLGLVTPHLLQALKSAKTSNIARNLAGPLSPEPAVNRTQSTNKQTIQPPQQQQAKASMTLPEHEFACDNEALARVLHENPVQGMHVLCMNQTMKSLKLAFFPGAQQTNAPASVEMEGLPQWSDLKTTIIQHFQLTPMDDLHQPWGMFSPDGELLCKENNGHVEMEGLVQMGMVLIFQGGQFVWPGVRIGFKRTIELYSTMPSGSPNMGQKKRLATLETLSLEPLVFSVEGFLDEEECDWFKEEATPSLKYSQVTLMDMDKGRPASDFRTSQSTFLSKNDHEIVKDIDYRTASLVRLPRFHQENVQVLRYGGGEKYDAHHDYFDPQLYQNDESTLKNFIQYGRRNRMITVFWYLSDVDEGGETIFPRFNNAPPPRSMSSCDVGLKVKPSRGKVIIFYSLKPDGSLDPLSLHGACPVKQGIKWAANKWVWNLPIEFGSGA